MKVKKEAQEKAELARKQFLKEKLLEQKLILEVQKEERLRRIGILYLTICVHILISIYLYMYIYV